MCLGSKEHSAAPKVVGRPLEVPSLCGCCRDLHVCRLSWHPDGRHTGRHVCRRFCRHVGRHSLPPPSWRRFDGLCAFYGGHRHDLLAFSNLSGAARYLLRLRFVLGAFGRDPLRRPSCWRFPSAR